MRIVTELDGLIIMSWLLSGLAGESFDEASSAASSSSEEFRISFVSGSCQIFNERDLRDLRSVTYLIAQALPKNTLYSISH